MYTQNSPMYMYVECTKPQHIDIIIYVHISRYHFSLQKGYSPLEDSAQVGDLSTVELLLREGAQVDFGKKVSLYVSNDLHSYMYTCMYVLVYKLHKCHISGSQKVHVQCTCIHVVSELIVLHCTDDLQ